YNTTSLLAKLGYAGFVPGPDELLITGFDCIHMCLVLRRYMKIVTARVTKMSFLFAEKKIHIFILHFCFMLGSTVCRFLVSCQKMTQKFSFQAFKTSFF